MKNTLAQGYKTWVIDRPYWVLLFLAVVTVGMAMGLPNFKLDASADALTLEADRDVDFARAVSQRYSSGDLLVISFKPHNELFTDESLALLGKLRDELLTVEGVAGANTILDVPLLYSPKQTLSQLRAGMLTLEKSEVDWQVAKQEFLNSPIYNNLLLGPDGQTTVIALSLAVDETYLKLVRERDALRLKRKTASLSVEEAQRLEQVTVAFRAYRTEAEARSRERVQRVREIAEPYKAQAELFVGGATMVTADMIAFIQSDLVVFGGAIVAFIVILLAVIFRQLRFVVLPLSISVLSVVIMLGLLSWIDWRLTVISTNFVALLLIVTLAISIHLVVRYRELQVLHPEWTQADLVLSTTQLMFRPCIYTTLTTVVAFMSLVVSGIRPVIDFGWMMTIGLGVSFSLVFLLLPSALMVLGKGPAEKIDDRSGVFTLKFSRLTERFGNGVLVVFVSLAVLSGYGMTRLSVDNRFIDYFHSSTEIFQGMKVIDKNFGGTIPLEIVLDWQDASLADTALSQVAESKTFAKEVQTDFANDEFDDGFSEDDSDAFADDDFGDDAFEADDFETDDFDENISSSEAVTSSVGIANTPVSRSEQVNSPWFTVAGLQRLESLQNYLASLDATGRVDSLAVLYQVARDINGGGLNDFELAVMKRMLPQDIETRLVNPYLQGNQVRFVARIKETDPNLKRLELIDTIRHHMVNELGFQPEQIRFTGALVLYNNMLESLFRSQILTLGAVFVAIMLMFMLLFRSLLLAVIGIIPNMLAACIVLGGMGLAGIPLDMMTITIAAITVGIGVDNTIHYLFRFRQEFAERGDYIATMHAAHGSIGRAMYYTSVIIIIGFSILALSKFIPSIYFGLLTGLAMLAAILGALTLLPKLILITKPFKAKPSESDDDSITAETA